jgi:WD40-like Beta Propeller Repeat
MTPKLGWVVAITALVLTTNAIPAPGNPRIEEQFGNIIYDQADGTRRQITNLHMDGQPTLSPDGKTIAFIRIEGQATTKGDPDFTALWVADGPTGNTKRLVGSNSSNDPKLNLQSIHSPTFSLDGHFVYVLADAWATSAAVHQVNIETGNERFVIDGNSDKVIRSGPYRGYLLVERHKYHPPPKVGSYNPVDVVRPDGHVEFTLPGTEVDDGADRVTPWLRQRGWEAW